MRRRFSSQFLGMNSTVVYRENAAYLVDPGVFPRETERIREFLERNTISEINLLLTHTHGDHISGWQMFRDYPCFAHQCVSAKSETVRNNDVRYLQGMWRKQGIEELSHLKFPDNIRYVQDGEFRHDPPFSFAFFHVPGHSVDMSAIVVPEENLLLSGDMLIQAPVPFILNSSRKYWDSLKRFRELVDEYDLHCLIPGHGKPAKSKAEIIKRIEHEQHYLQKLIWEGMKLARAGMRGEDLRQELYNLSDRYAKLHSHQSNVQTFLRELDDWLQSEGPTPERES